MEAGVVEVWRRVRCGGEEGVVLWEGHGVVWCDRSGVQGRRGVAWYEKEEVNMQTYMRGP